MSRKRRTAADEPFLVMRTASVDIRAGSDIAAHAHDWHQLIYVRSGLMTVRTAAASWVAPPTWAVWVRAGTVHSIRFVGSSALRTIYLRPDWHAELPQDCRGLAVSALLRELIARTSSLGMLDRREPIEHAIAALIVGELHEAGPPLALPEPSTAATQRAATVLIERADVTPARAAAAVGLGLRTLERRFRAETGMTLGRWRQHRMLLTGLERVADGASVASAASAAGYASPSAYIAAFKKAFGATPMQYFRIESHADPGVF